MESRRAPIAAKISRTPTPGSSPPAIAPTTKQTAAPKIAPDISRSKDAATLSTGFQPPPVRRYWLQQTAPMFRTAPHGPAKRSANAHGGHLSLSPASPLRWLSTGPNGSSRLWGSPWQGVSPEYLNSLRINASFASSHQAIKTHRSIEKQFDPGRSPGVLRSSYPLCAGRCGSRDCLTRRVRSARRA